MEKHRISLSDKIAMAALLVAVLGLVSGFIFYLVKPEDFKAWVTPWLAHWGKLSVAAIIAIIIGTRIFPLKHGSRQIALVPTPEVDPAKHYPQMILEGTGTKWLPNARFGVVGYPGPPSCAKCDREMVASGFSGLVFQEWQCHKCGLRFRWDSLRGNLSDILKSEAEGQMRQRGLS